MKRKGLLIGLFLVLVLAIAAGGFGLFKMNIEVSEKRNPDIQVCKVADSLSIKTWGAIYIEFGSSDFFPSSFCIESDELVVYVDPVMIENGEKADYILITHSHADHFSIEDIKNLTDEDTVIVGPKKVANKLKKFHFVLVEPGDEESGEGINIEAVASYSQGFPSHPKPNMNVGYILTVEGLRLYFSGDTFVVPELLEIKDIDVAVVPIDGGNLTMETDQAAEFINNLNPSIVIPSHYIINENKAEDFAKLINDPIEVIILG